MNAYVLSATRWFDSSSLIGVYSSPAKALQMARDPLWEKGRIARVTIEISELILDSPFQLDEFHEEIREAKTVFTRSFDYPRNNVDDGIWKEDWYDDEFRKQTEGANA